MLRSNSQVLYSYLPGAVFRHEDRVYGKVVAVDGTRLTELNDAVIYEEIATYLQRWPEDQRHDLPLPKDIRIKDYRLLRPEQVRWELFPLVFECGRRACGRVRSFRTFDELAKAPACQTCKGPLQQLRFYNAHNCGLTRPIHGPKCSVHGYDDLFFENTGSFLTATWRCRGASCGGGVVSRTNMSPCSCKGWPGPDNVVRMRAHTLDDTRAYQAHYIDLVNIDSSAFQTYQRHPDRAQIAVAHYLGAISGIKDGISDADTNAPSERMSAEAWAAKAAVYKELGLGADDVDILKSKKGPADSGLAAVGPVSPAVLETVAAQRPFYERAAVFDQVEVPRLSLADQLHRAQERGDLLQSESLEAATGLAARMGISELAVTWEFPIAKVAFGFTRERHQPGEAAIRGFYRKNQNDNKFPVYAVTASTEALLVTLSAVDVLGYLKQRGETDIAPCEESGARRQLLELFAAEAARPFPTQTVRTLVHTLSHLLLRGLDDGQVGFAEASLAEWLVPETLTFAVYANNLKAFTLGSLWTLLNNRALSWLNGVVDRSMRCENDPICYQSKPRSCERCSYVTFGCRLFNGGLDRKLLVDFLSWRGVLESTGRR